MDLQRELGFLNTKIDVKQFVDTTLTQAAAKRLN